MSNIINLSEKKHDKDCPDWIPLPDGTITGDPKYCGNSLNCKQIGFRSDWHWFIDEIK